MNYGAGSTEAGGGYKLKDKLDFNDPYTVNVLLLLLSFILDQISF
jgi:hypothetical protein